ncbi:MAG: DNA polymerase III subunit delta [Chloroflexi bacterium]|nr:DNA polymerase III subunit delta [Chloroflexota bacterium]
MIFLLQDDFFGQEQLALLKAQFGDRGLQDLNTTVHDGPKSSLEELQRACEAVPFLAERRLVIVRRMLGKAEPRSASATSARKGQKSDLEQKLCYFIEGVPAFTDLVFVEDRAISEQSSVVKAIRRLGGKIVQGRILKDVELQNWIEQRVRTKHGRINRAAAYELASCAGDDLRALDNEIDKLLAYAESGEISEHDVRTLASNAREANVFNLVDAVGRRDVRSALQLLQELLDDGASAQYLMVMITRQFRILLQAKELAERGISSQDVAATLRVHPFVARKALEQSRNFGPISLAKAYARLAEADRAVKTGRLDDETAVHLLIVELGTAARPSV